MGCALLVFKGLDYKRNSTFSTPKQKEKRITDTLLFSKNTTFTTQRACTLMTGFLCGQKAVEPATNDSNRKAIGQSQFIRRDSERPLGNVDSGLGGVILYIY